MQEVTVTTGSRLHFGLLNVVAQHDAIRSYGGVGLMIEQPGICLTISPAAVWSAEGPLASRALEFAKRFLKDCSVDSRFAIKVQRCAPEHVGLGTGTQLGMAVARALVSLLDWRDVPTGEIARRVGRGVRSGIGVHGFARGGFLVDGGTDLKGNLATLVAHLSWPKNWRILLIIPKHKQGIFGAREAEVFAGTSPNSAAVDTLSRLVLLGILPSLIDRDFASFSQSLYEFNRRVGETFSPWQGGVYCCTETAAVVEFLTRHGVKGAGQSSWGPTVFGIVLEHDAASIINAIERHFSNAEVDIVNCSAWTPTAPVSQ